MASPPMATYKTESLIIIGLIVFSRIAPLASGVNTVKQWERMDLIVPDRVSKTLFICSLHLTADLFLNKIQFDAGFSERLKIKEGVQTTLDPTVA